MKKVFINHGSVIVEEVPASVVDDNGVLVEVGYSLISTGTELSGVKQSGKTLLQRAVEQPEKVKKVFEIFKEKGIQKTVSVIQQQTATKKPTGYSCSGIVMQVGKNVSEFAPGDRVACAGAGIANHAEVVMVPKNLIVKVPRKCNLRDAASVTLGSIAMQGVRRADPRLGEKIAVIGLGLLGQITVQLLKAAGCQIIGFDLKDDRVEKGLELGLDYGYNPMGVDIHEKIRYFTNTHGVDITIITASSSSDEIVQQAMEITRKKGRVVVVGDVGLGLKRYPFYKKEIDFLISCSYGPGRYDHRYEEQGLDYPYAYVRWTEKRNMEEFLRLVAEGSVDIQSIIEKEYDISDAPQAFKSLQSVEKKPLGVLLSYGLKERRPGIKYSTTIPIKPIDETSKIRLALVGAGSFAKNMHLPNITKLSDLYSLRAIVSSTSENAKSTAEEFGAGYATTDFDEVLDDDQVDAVMICTRHNLHAPMAIKAAQANKGIFLEKPMALNQEELDDLIGVLNETKVPFMVGFNRRFSPAARRVKELISNRQSPLVMLYRVNAGYLSPDHWTQRAEGGGRIIGEACHMFDLFQYFVSPSHVVELSSTKIPPMTDDFSSSDNFVSIVRFDDDSVGTLSYISLGSKDLSKEYIEIYLDGKVLVIDDFYSLKVFGSSEQGWSSSVKNKGHYRELKIFAKYIQTDIVAPISISEMSETHRISFQI